MYMYSLDYICTYVHTRTRMHTRTCTHIHTQGCSYGCEAVPFQYQVGPGMAGFVPGGAQQKCGIVEDVSAWPCSSCTSHFHYIAILGWWNVYALSVHSKLTHNWAHQLCLCGVYGDHTCTYVATGAHLTSLSYYSAIKLECSLKHYREVSV